jgi:hypothetical protein
VILTRLISQTIPPVDGTIQTGLDGIAPPTASIVPQLAAVPAEKNNKLHVNK